MTVTLIFGAMFSAKAWSQATAFNGSYDGASIFGGVGKTSFDFSGAEPAASGAYPVFAYMVETVESCGSGWLIVQTRQREQGRADHCYALARPRVKSTHCGRRLERWQRELAA